MPCLKGATGGVKACFSSFHMIDFFAMKPSERITFHKNNTYSTFIGRLTTWILIGIYIATFLNFGNDMIYRKNPQSIFSQIVTPDPENLNLNEMGFFMAFGFQDLRNHSAHYINESIYTVQLIKRTKVNGVISLQTIPTGRCGLDNVPNRDDLKSYYGRNSINQLYCIKNDSEIEPELKSTWDGAYYKNLLINFYPCVNSTENGNFCQPKEVIKEYLDSANFAIYFTTDAVDPNNFQKPVVSFGKQLYTPISSSTLTYIEMLFGHFNFITDVGFLFQDLETFRSAYYLNNRQVLSFSSNIIVQIDMKLDKIKTIYSRKYDKIQNVLASIGGIIKALMLLSQAFVLPFIRLNFRLNLANSIFTFKTDKKSNNLIKKIKKSTQLPISSPNINIQKDKSSSEKAEKTKKKRDEFTKRETTQINISYFKYFMNCFGNSTARVSKKLLNQGLDQIDSVLDISYIMKKLVEIDLLKVLLLTEEQNNLFEFIPKPQVVLKEPNIQQDESKNDLHMTFSNYFGKKNPDIKQKLREDSLQMIMSKNFRSPVDQKLLDMMSGSHQKKKRKPSQFQGPKKIENEQNINANVDELMQDNPSRKSMDFNNINNIEIPIQENNKNIILFEEDDDVNNENQPNSQIVEVKDSEQKENKI